MSAGTPLPLDSWGMSWIKCVAVDTRAHTIAVVHKAPTSRRTGVPLMLTVMFQRTGAPRTRQPPWTGPATPTPWR